MVVGQSSSSCTPPGKGLHRGGEGEGEGRMLRFALSFMHLGRLEDGFDISRVLELALEIEWKQIWSEIYLGFSSLEMDSWRE